MEQGKNPVQKYDDLTEIIIKASEDWLKEFGRMNLHLEHKAEYIAGAVRDAGYIKQDSEEVLKLPCKLGTDVYVIKRCRCGDPDRFKAGTCGRRRVARTPEVYGRRMILEKKTKFRVDVYGRVIRDIDIPAGTICYTINKKPLTLDMIAAFGKTVFVSLEAAKEALDEIWRKAK
jgi:hypothetical protein